MKLKFQLQFSELSNGIGRSSVIKSMEDKTVVHVQSYLPVIECDEAAFKIMKIMEALMIPLKNCKLNKKT